ncbi:unnamed protein product [Mesocestoides corti]|uniref:Uncharacterized protein n=2 Tax=Mesocestoides corti TaxID=53468 RepID=A0A0R3ULN1_MESCO|nr:unnamed protein product [Mesocestoides corti]
MFAIPNGNEKQMSINTPSLHNGATNYPRVYSNKWMPPQNQTPARVPPPKAKFTIKKDVKISQSQYNQTDTPVHGTQFGNIFRSTSTQKTLEMSSAGLRVFSVPVRRIRGLTPMLNKLENCPYIFETVGTIVESDETPSLSHSVAFYLEELANKSRGVQLKCNFSDIDGIHPEIYYGRIYRCVGKFSTIKGTFQCYSITPCDDDELKLQEILQMHSDNAITQLLPRT